MRGGVSLAAALAIASHGFPKREFVIFVAYAVIVLTLVIPGLTLAPLLRRLGLSESEDDRRSDAEARLRITQAALERLEELDGPEHIVQRLRDRYGARVERLEARLEGDHDEDGRTDVAIAGQADGRDDRGRARRPARDALRARVPRRRAQRDRT